MKSLILLLLLPALCLASNVNQRVNIHGSLAGLSADDHELYLPRSGSRGMTGTLTGVNADFTQCVTATHLYRGAVEITGGAAFFGTEHDNDTGAHTNVTAQSVTSSGGVTATTIDISSRIIRFPSGNGIVVLNGHIVARVASGLGFDPAGNITPTYSATADVSTLGSATGSGGIQDRIARGDHVHPTPWGEAGDPADVTATTGWLGSVQRFSRANHGHGHAVFAAGDLHTEYLRADGTRALAGAWNLNDFELSNIRVEAQSSAQEPSAGVIGKLWFGSTAGALTVDTGSVLIRLREIVAGTGIGSVTSGGVTTLSVTAGTGLQLDVDGLSIDTGVVPRLAADNVFSGTNRFHQIDPQDHVNSNLGSSTNSFYSMYGWVWAPPNGYTSLLLGDADLVLSGSGRAFVPGGAGGGSVGRSGTAFGAAYVNGYYGASGTTPAPFPYGIRGTDKGAVQAKTVTILNGSTSAAVTWGTSFGAVPYVVIPVCQGADIGTVWPTDITGSGCTVNTTNSSGPWTIAVLGAASQ